MKKLLSLLIVFIMFISCFACSFGDDTIVLTIKKSHLSEEDFILQQKVMTEYVAAFNKKYPDIEIQIQYVNDLPGDFKDTDVILMSADEVLEFAPTDLKILSDECGDSIGKLLTPAANIGLLQIDTQEPETYFLPFNYDRAVVYADKGIFDKFDVDLPTKDWTYDEFVEVSKKFSRKYGNESYTGVHLPLSKSYVWKYHFEQLGSGWYSENGIVNFDSDKNKAVIKDIINLYKKKNAKCYSYTEANNQLWEAPVAMAWLNAYQPDYDDYRLISEKAAQSLVGRRIDEIAAKENLILLPLPRNGENESYSYSNTDFIDGFAISRFISENKTENALKLIEFSQTLEGNSILNSYYSGIPANKELVSEDYWKTGYITGNNAESLLVGIENDKRDDYAELLKDDFYVFEKNLRMRSIASEYLNVEFKNSLKRENTTEKIFNDIAKIFNSTINAVDSNFSYYNKAVNKENQK